ncbi:hypothetical protein RRG08_041308 [Elysia crispata]|uniref:Uncharacterized protein n=1 Tax=Elysia crispata TaxID=231223 RepID=A0AAE0ZVA5_9GAST|nr:hypothetical protein RRG08_041308 [Elysia crispata]
MLNETKRDGGGMEISPVQSTTTSLFTVKQNVRAEIACHHPHSTRGPSRDSLSPPSLNPSKPGVGADIACHHPQSTRGPSRDSLSPPSLNPRSEPR